MRAIAIDYTRRELTDREVPEPGIRHQDEVLLEVLQVGVCGTDRDLAALRIGRGPDGDEYLVPGHEAACRILQAGPLAGDLKTGDIVVPQVRRPCAPPCEFCSAGRHDLCATGRYTERGILGAHGYFTERAVDRARDVFRIPADAAAHAVLLEPLSVVEKAVDVALRLHAGEPRRALVFGAGSIGLLCAAVLRLRGLECLIVSVEPRQSARARLVQAAGADYDITAPRSEFDIAIEAAGSPEVIAPALDALRPNGVLIVLGARTFEGKLPMLDLILGNRIVAGSVNASPGHFSQAAANLSRIPAPLLESMVDVRPWGDYRDSFLGKTQAGEAPKIVHRIAVNFD
ncbi:MAG TPA: alcohol dehydrogenase catalytic domain-containing protein [Bryobacteraceae bacterium]|nr:alcohol dehydrogenase catalytic domain-containing protein [Bryobacteraceae bacterium]